MDESDNSTEINRHVEALTGSGLATESAILSNKKVVENYTGIYFLIKGSVIVYVGQSVNVFTRAINHKENYDYDSMSWIAYPRDELDYFESAYIHAFKPKYNGAYPNGNICAPLSAANLVLKKTTKKLAKKKKLVKKLNFTLVYLFPSGEEKLEEFQSESRHAAVEYCHKKIRLYEKIERKKVEYKDAWEHSGQPLCL